MTRKKKSSSAEGAAPEPNQAEVAKAPAAKAPAAKAPAAKASAAKAPAAAEPKAPAAPAAAAEKVPDKPKAKPEAKAKGEAKAKAKAKAETVEAKSEPKAKAEAKAKPEAKAKAKAEAKAAEPKAASSKAAAKPKAKGAASAPAAVQQPKAPPKAPSPVPAPTVVESQAADGLEVVVSRKNRRRKKKAEELPEETEEPVKPTEPSEEELAKQETIKAQHDEKNNAMLTKFQEQLKCLPDIANKPREEVIKEVGEQQKALQQMLVEIDSTLKCVKIQRPKNVNTGSLMKNMIELKQCKDDGVYMEDTKAKMLSDVEQALSKALAFESFRTFQAEMTQLKDQVQEKLDANEAIAKTVKSGNAHRRVVERVAKAKGVKADELTEDQVKSVTVDLPPEVTVNSFLYKGRFEKQFGVLIDRPDGNSKGGGKGASMMPVKSLTVRGVEGEVQGCVAALKALDLSERKVLQLTPKQASAVMGAQQANARQLEEKHEGVFISSERGQKVHEITFYGPPKKVAACLKDAEAMVVEEPPAANPSTTSENVIRIDQDLAKAFIGPQGKNVKKLQTDTGMRIEVDHKREDETPASIKIVGDQANINKARDEIKAFLSTLSTCVVEGEPEVVSRLFDTIRKGKGKGKSNTGNNSAGSSRFADLYKNSGLTVLNKVKGVKLAGEKEDVNKWKVVLEDCLKEEASVPVTIKLTFEQKTLWNQERLDSVKQSSGASRVQKVQRGRETLIEVNGTDDDKEKAKAAIEELNTKLSSVDSIEEVPEKATRSLSGKGKGKLQEVEQKFGVYAFLDRTSHVIKIQGSEDSVSAAKKRIQQMISSAGASNASREIEIEWEEGGVIIGKSGSMVKQIKQESGATVTIREDEEKKVVVLRGTEEAVEAAAQMVEEALQNARNPKPVEAAAGGTAEAAPAEKPATKEVAPTAQTSTNGAEAEKRPAPAKSKGKGGAAKADEKIELGKDSFPTLGSSSGDKAKKTRPVNSAWKTDEDGDAEEKPDEEAKEEEQAEEDGANDETEEKEEAPEDAADQGN